jgi:hypothetical protein
MKKIIVILVCTLFTATALPVFGSIDKLKNGNSKEVIFINKGPFSTSENGVIIDQELDNNKGYSVIRVWGSDYEMGYAHA